MNYFYILSDNIDPYQNLAMEQILFRCADRETTILFLWQNDHTIVVGRNQDIYIECKVEEFLASGGYLARRRSGGGAVYHDMGNLNFSIISLEAITERCEYRYLIKKMLESFGLVAEFNGRNDLLIQGKKFSGNAFYSDGHVLCQHGTILINTDIEKMDYYLTPNIEKLARNCVKSVKSRVANLSEFSKNICVEDVKQAIIFTAKAKELHDIRLYQKKEIDKLIAFYRSKEWILNI